MGSGSNVIGKVGWGHIKLSLVKHSKYLDFLLSAVENHDFHLGSMNLSRRKVTAL